MSRRIRFIYGVTDANPVGDLFPSYVFEEVEGPVAPSIHHSPEADAMCVEEGCPHA